MPFSGDSLDSLKKLQIQTARWMTPMLFQTAWERYRRAVTLLKVQDQFVEAYGSASTYDWGLLLDAYYRIAEWFRFQPNYRGQVTIPYDGATPDQETSSRWTEFWRAECTRLVEIDGVARCVVRAVLHISPEARRKASERLCELLDEEYHAMREPLRFTDPSDERGAES